MILLTTRKAAMDDNAMRRVENIIITELTVENIEIFIASRIGPGAGWLCS